MLSCFILLGYRLVWPKATVFEIVIIGSNPITPANKFTVFDANIALVVRQHSCNTIL